jgi:hypothetical protein
MPIIDDTRGSEDEVDRIRNIIDKDYFAQDQQRDWSNEDMRFCDVDGAMYEDWFEEQFSDRPRMEFNKVAQAVHRFVGEWASNRFETKFVADNGRASEEDADLLSGLHRKDFRRSHGAEAVDNAVQEMAKGGFSAWQLSTEFVDEEDIENDKQRVVFEPIFSAYSSVIFDRNAKRYDKSDARWVTKLQQMTLQAAQEEWGEDVASAFTPPNQNRFNWNNGTFVWIANFYEIRKDKKDVIILEDPLGRRKAVFEDDLKGVMDELADGGYEEVSRRKKTRQTVWKTIISDSKVLEPARRIPGKLLPIIPCYGFRSYIDGKEFWYGIVRKNKDANRLFNMAATSVAESAATTSLDMPIFTDEQVEGRENQLSEMHLGKFNYAVVNQLYNEDGTMIPSGPAGVWASPRVDPNTAAVMEIAGNYIQEETTGNLQEATNPQITEKALTTMVQRLDMNTFVLMDNIAKSLKRSGEVYRAIAGEIYDTEQKVNLIEEDGTEKEALLFELVVDEESGQTRAINDIRNSEGVFEVVVDTGPAFSSRRRETLEALKDIMTITPPDSPYTPFLYSELINNIDGVGLQGLKDFNSEQMLMQGLRQPENEEEAAKVQQAQQNQRNEQAEYLQALAAESNANAQESISNVEKNSTQAQKNLADAAETIAGIDISRFKAVNDVAEQRAERAAQFARDQLTAFGS